MKYYYQQGICSTMQCLSLNPVKYEKTDEDNVYEKVEMACTCVEKGKCDKKESCKLLEDAPDKIRDNGVILRSTKL